MALNYKVNNYKLRPSGSATRLDGLLNQDQAKRTAQTALQQRAPAGQISTGQPEAGRTGGLRAQPQQVGNVSFRDAAQSANSRADMAKQRMAPRETGSVQHFMKIGDSSYVDTRDPANAFWKNRDMANPVQPQQGASPQPAQTQSNWIQIPGGWMDTTTGKVSNVNPSQPQTATGSQGLAAQSPQGQPQVATSSAGLKHTPGAGMLTPGMTHAEVAQSTGMSEAEVRGAIEAGYEFYRQPGGVGYFHPGEDIDGAQRKQAIGGHTPYGSAGEDGQGWYTDEVTQGFRDSFAQKSRQQEVDEFNQRRQSAYNRAEEAAKTPLTDYNAADASNTNRLDDMERRFAQQQARTLQQLMARSAASGMSPDQLVGTSAQISQQYGSEAETQRAQQMYQYDMWKVQAKAQDSARSYNFYMQAYQNASNEAQAAVAWERMMKAQKESRDYQAQLQRMENENPWNIAGSILKPVTTLGGAALGMLTGGAGSAAVAGAGAAAGAAAGGAGTGTATAPASLRLNPGELFSSQLPPAYLPDVPGYSNQLQEPGMYYGPPPGYSLFGR